MPTLILAGEYDPLTPPSYGTIAGRTLHNSRSFMLPAVGHNVQRSSPCAHSMMIDFLADAIPPRRDLHLLNGTARLVYSRRIASVR